MWHCFTGKECGCWRSRGTGKIGTYTSHLQRWHCTLTTTFTALSTHLPISISVMKSANHLFPVVTVDARFVEIRQRDGELHALYMNGAQGTWYSVDKLIVVQIMMLGSISYFQLWNNVIKQWLYKRESTSQPFRLLDMPTMDIRQSTKQTTLSLDLWLLAICCYLETVC